ncbi:MAG: hypothetical protein JF571_07515 [Asticcacaulis sp.]|nr:hypothetical protein [Asticcacaulis sp.]
MAGKGSRPFKWLRGLTLTLQILLWIVVVFEALAAALWLAALFVNKTDVPYEAIAWMTCAAGALPYVIAMLVLPVWTAVAASARPKRPGDHTRLWAWLGYLIPGVCYVAPALVLRSLAHESAPQDAILRVLVLAFWLVRLTTTFLAGFLLMVVCIIAFNNDAGRATPSWLGILTICVGAASWLGIRLTARLSRAVISHTADIAHTEVF